MSNEESNYHNIVNGQLPGAEIVIGLVGAVGVNLKGIVKDIIMCFEGGGDEGYGYTTYEIHVSDLIEKITEIPEYSENIEFERKNALMNAGDEARKSTEKNAILALLAVSEINTQRHVEGASHPQCRHVYIINSLKHPDEVNALRRIYGNGFFLIGVYAEPEDRKNVLTRRKNMSEEQADKLMKRDESEGLPYGQSTRDTFHLSDFFVHLLEGNEDEVKKTQNTLKRFLKVVFASPYQTPLFDEYAMFMAFAAATRSADLSRQIGAVVAKNNEVLATGVNDCPRYGGGTYWPQLNASGEASDENNGRDYRRGIDSNDQEKSQLVEGIVEAVRIIWKDHEKESETPDEALLKKAIYRSPVDDITEYGRAVHAEMEALLVCARNNISCRGGTLYTTTFPCHNCAKHIIAAGIKRVVYIEPYPKSKALKFHSDSAFAGFHSNADNDDLVAFEPFVGIGPRRFFDLFSMKQGSGFPLKRKNKNSGKTLPWEPKNGMMRMPMLPWSYLEREEIALQILKAHLRGESYGQQREDPGQTT